MSVGTAAVTAIRTVISGRVDTRHSFHNFCRGPVSTQKKSSWKCCGYIPVVSGQASLQGLHGRRRRTFMGGQREGVAAFSLQISADANEHVVVPQSLDGLGQRQAFIAAVHDRKNLFLTGGPGTGKSHTLREIIKALRAANGVGKDGVLVTAPTGVAALIAGGQTLQSSPGPGIPKGTTGVFDAMSTTAWSKVKVLVIDEISMVDAEFFDWYMLKVPPKVQIILCGDFAQLPPVPQKQESLDNEDHCRGILPLCGMSVHVCVRT